MVIPVREWLASLLFEGRPRMAGQSAVPLRLSRVAEAGVTGGLLLRAADLHKLTFTRVAGKCRLSIRKPLRS